MFLVTERPVNALDVTMDGKALALNENALSARCEEHGVTPLLAFLSPSAEQQLAVMESFGLTGLTPLAEKWFTPDEGLRTTSVLLEIVTDEPEWFYDSQSLLGDLRRLQEILTALQPLGARWHLDIDI